MNKFTEEVLNNEGKILVKFGADWCEPCKMVTPILEKLGDEGYNVYEVNIDTDPDNTIKYGIRGVPTFIVFENGQKIKQESGVKSKNQLIQMLQN